MTIVVQYEGIPGESTIQGFEKYIEVDSFQLGVGRHIASAFGTSTREGGIVSISEITVVKKTDGTSVKLFEEACMGKLNKKVDFKFLRTGSGAPQEFLAFETNGTGISGLSFSASGGGDSRPMESLSFNFDKISIKYNPIGDDFSGSPATWGWDLAKAAKL
ncbi:type VI secretion system tube protein Hcp [Roseomonas sp. PWR1]|uniref:Type VI secretion system tube protein Hcp n=1 Tax=Roseomonas nitratireducens TaxID=2820810 RepID=A0ABS4AZF7_9PROT|nr:type VI secretion system tube protein Hcp [Neoroseomonas nitratireducens]MBP0466764.1 type VI secretion system tube protein Hcp [Neoroseomonas nitratireducens]